MLKTFMPNGLDTISLAVSPVSTSAEIDRNSAVVRVVNRSTEDVFIAFGTASTASTLLKMPILAGAAESFTKGGATHIAAICAAGSGTLYVTCGEGI